MTTVMGCKSWKSQYNGGCNENEKDSPLGSAHSSNCRTSNGLVSETERDEDIAGSLGSDIRDYEDGIQFLINHIMGVHLNTWDFMAGYSINERKGRLRLRKKKRIFSLPWLFAIHSALLVCENFLPFKPCLKLLLTFLRIILWNFPTWAFFPLR